MSKNKIKSKDLDKIGFYRNTSKSIAVVLIAKHFKHTPREEVIELMLQVKNDPATYLDDPVLAPLATTFMDKLPDRSFTVHELRADAAPVKVYGKQFISGDAIRQMDIALQLPVAHSGAAMPDAHSGFGLPIGGVLATVNSVIPFGVGLDIGCRMALSVFDLPESFIENKRYEIKQALLDFTHFGTDGALEFAQEHAVLDDDRFNAIPLLKKLHGKAVRQLGSSGSGNHFVEFGVIDLYTNNTLGLSEGRYVALLSHSGSRGMGANIAQHYTDLAMKVCKLPKQAQHLAWLSLDSAEGQEYWLSMNLAGDYAKACHERIHINLSHALGINPVALVENHHNFAWKDKAADGSEVIIHRKGATPAHKGELGIIPGSMINGGYLVCGKGESDSLYSASHGAGRSLSRRHAKESISGSEMRKMISASDVTLIGGSTEESPLAYKDIDEVMKAQMDLVDVQGKFTCKVVRMNKE